MKHVISMLDDLSSRLEGLGHFQNAQRVDKVAQLLVTAEEDIPATVSELADSLAKHLEMDTDDALSLAKDLFEVHSGEGEGDEKEGFFPVGALPQHERREGPRPEDVPQSGAKWWEGK